MNCVSSLPTIQPQFRGHRENVFIMNAIRVEQGALCSTRGERNFVGKSGLSETNLIPLSSRCQSHQANDTTPTCLLHMDAAKGKILHLFASRLDGNPREIISLKTPSCYKTNSNWSSLLGKTTSSIGSFVMESENSPVMGRNLYSGSLFKVHLAVAADSINTSSTSLLRSSLPKTWKSRTFFTTMIDAFTKLNTATDCVLWTDCIPVNSHHSPKSACFTIDMLNLWACQDNDESLEISLNTGNSRLCTKTSIFSGSNDWSHSTFQALSIQTAVHCHLSNGRNTSRLLKLRIQMQPLTKSKGKILGLLDVLKMNHRYLVSACIHAMPKDASCGCPPSKADQSNGNTREALPWALKEQQSIERGSRSNLML
nr:hypothetical protein Iba_chr12cCG24610 [Ipomoea batatas]